MHPDSSNAPGTAVSRLVFIWSRGARQYPSPFRFPTSAQVQDAVNAVADQVAAAAEAAPAAETPAEAVRVEVVDAEAPETGAEA